MKDITEDQLAKDWTLSEQDIDCILSNARLEDHRLRSAIQLCILRKTGRFTSDCSKIPLKAANYLTHQLTQSPVLEVPDLTRTKADYPRFAKIQTYLGYKEFDESEKQDLEKWLSEQAQSYCSDKKELTLRVKEQLRSRRILVPSPTNLGRFISTAISNALLALYHNI